MTDVARLTMGAPSTGGAASILEASFRVSSDTDPDTDAPYSIDEGMPVYPVNGDPDADIVLKKAQANAIGTAVVPGLAASAAEAPASARVKFAGPLTLTTEQWDAITGDSGGLTPLAIYYLSAADAGMLTTTPPTSPNYVTVIGFALSPTTMMLQIAPPVLGAGG